jgi:hypothetical protein
MGLKYDRAWTLNGTRNRALTLHCKPRSDPSIALETVLRPWFRVQLRVRVRVRVRLQVQWGGGGGPSTASSAMEGQTMVLSAIDGPTKVAML